MKKILFSCCVLSMVFMYGVGFCTYTGESPETESPSLGNSLFTKYEDNLLSVDIKDVPLGEVLQKLSDETGVLFSFPPAVGEERVMVRFSNFTIADALKKILSSHDRIFIYEETQPDSDESVPSRLKEVRIYTPPTKGTTNRGSTSKPSTVTHSNSSQPTQVAKSSTVARKTGKRPNARTSGMGAVNSLADDLKDTDYKVRLDAVSNLSRIRNADAIGHLTSALEDKNPEVKKAAQNALEDIQADNESEELGKDSSSRDSDQPTEAEGAPVIDYSVSGDSDNMTVDINLSDVQEPLITAAVMLEFDPTALKVNDATFKDGWDKSMSNANPVDKEPGKYVLTAGNLSNANPDDSSNLGLASIQYQCLTGNCSGQQIKVHPVPGFDSFVGSGAGVYDPKIDPVIITIP